MLALGGQLRVTSGFKPHILGYDMTAAFALAEARGFDLLVVGELLPDIEAVVVRKLNEQVSDAS